MTSSGLTLTSFGLIVISSGLIVISFDLLDGFDYETLSVFKVGKILKTIKRRGIKDISFVGGIKKPSFTSIKFDITTFFFLLKLLKLKLKGDDAVLRAIANFVEKKGLNLKGVMEIAPKLIIQEDMLTQKRMKFCLNSMGFVITL